MSTFLNDYIGHVTCNTCNWEGDAEELELTILDRTQSAYICPECLSTDILDF